jgi:integrase
MLDEEANYTDIVAILGHSSSLVTETMYARLAEDRMLEIADTFAPRRRTKNR